MAEIIESTSSEGEGGGMKMASQFVFNDGICEYELASGSTGWTCYGSFTAPGVPNGTKLSFTEDESQFGIDQYSGAKLEGNLGVTVSNKGSMISEHGYLSMIWQYQDRKQGKIVATFIAPKQGPDQTLLKLPEFEGLGWGGWAGPV